MRLIGYVVVSVLLVAPPCVMGAGGTALSADEALVDELRDAAGGEARVSYSERTGLVRFLGTAPGRSIRQKTAVAVGSTPEVAARTFLADYGEIFGIGDQAGELAVVRSRTASGGRSFVRFQQVYDGIPVMGGELVVQVDAAGGIISVNGEIVPSPLVYTEPSVSAEEASEVAREAVAKWYGLYPDKLTVSAPVLSIYNPAVMGWGADSNFLVWRTNAYTGVAGAVDELVCVDAQRGTVALHFSRIEEAKNRKIYDNNGNPNAGLPGTGPVRIEGQGATGIADVDNAYDYAGDAYDFYKNTHNRDGLDEAGMTIIETVRFCYPAPEPCPYQNAFWSTQYQQMVFGSGYASAEDVVGHELTHAVTSNESKLFYYMQSGAINESFSDIWGEFIELTYNAGPAADRWKLGEDLPAGALRDMKNPPAMGDPDRMGSANFV
ncbi:MAG TPA: hypothetical protein EYP14_11025, partial [Planctomycetaceae bacterium]|nr:hypothetical protein [Planctomycetaceae bacterium]